MRTRFLEVAGGRLAYDDTDDVHPGGGSGPLGGARRPLVVCLPGLGDVREVFRFLRPLLVDAGYRVVTMDLRGHGESSTGWPDYSQDALGSDVVALLTHLGAGPAVVVGSSYTGASAVWAAAEAPALTAGIVCLDGVLRAHPLGAVTRVAAHVVATFPTAWSAFYAHSHPTAPPADLREYRSMLVRRMREPGRRTAMRAMLFGASQDAEKWTNRVKCPALIVMGSKDADFPDPAAEARWQADAVHGRMVLLDGAGHYPHAEFPDRTAAAVLPFLAETLGA